MIKRSETYTYFFHKVYVLAFVLSCRTERDYLPQVWETASFHIECNQLSAGTKHANTGIRARLIESPLLLLMSAVAGGRRCPGGSAEDGNNTFLFYPRPIVLIEVVGLYKQ